MSRTQFNQLDAFTRQYIITALWSTNDESDESGGVPLDQNYDHRDISDETYAAMIEDCRKFQADNAADIAEAIKQYPKRNDDTGPLGSAGHDFMLTQNHHGAGFWDGDLEEELGERLTKAAHAFKELNLYVGDDKKIYS